MKSQNLTIIGKATATVPASAPFDLVRLSEMSGIVRNKSDKGHTHLTADITDLPTQLSTLVAAVTMDTGGFYFRVTPGGLLSGTVRLRGGGGILQDGSGLYLDPSNTFEPGAHTHLLTDITDFDTQLPIKLSEVLGDSNSFQWIFGDGTQLISGVVLVKNNGGLLSDANGLSADLGSGVNQVARGNHSHALLHLPLTVQPSNSITVTFDAPSQTLGLDVRVTPGAGLLPPNPISGVQVDFGTGHNQAARGDHTHPATSLTVVQTTSVTLGINSNQLSGVVRLDPAPGGTNAALAVGPNGVFAPTGTDPGTLAAGNHTHAIVTVSADGFMSKDMLARFTTLTATLSGVSQVGTVRAVNNRAPAGLSGVVSLTTSDIPEGNNPPNLYYTTLRAKVDAIQAVLTGFAPLSGVPSATDTVLTGMEKLQYEVALAQGGIKNLNGKTGAVVTLLTADVAESVNLYYTTNRAQVDAPNSPLVSWAPYSGIVTPGSDTILTAMEKLAYQVGYLGAGGNGFITTLTADATYVRKDGTTPMTGPLSFTGTGHAGVNLNRLSSTEIAGLTPAKGMLVYNTTIDAAQVYDALGWDTIPGSTGISWFSGIGVPGFAAVNGSFYLNESTGDIYKRIASAWVLIYEFSTGALKIGVTDGSNASAGIIGEYYDSSNHSAFAVSLTELTTNTLTLPPGDWMIYGYFTHDYQSALVAGSGASALSPTSSLSGSIVPSYDGAIDPGSPNTAKVSLTSLLRSNSSSSQTISAISLLKFSSGSVEVTSRIFAIRTR